MKILIIGESCKDIFHYGTTARLCPEAPVPVFNSIEFIESGGMAMNVYNNVAALDVAADIITNKDWENISKTRIVDKRTNHMFLRIDKNDYTYPKGDISSIDFGLYTAVIVSDYDKGFLNIDDLKQISLSHPLTFLDTKKTLGAWAENYTFIKINNAEYENSRVSVDEKLRDRLIVTQGPRGCFYKNHRYPVPTVEVKDTSGAGDTFVSALCVEYCKTHDINQALTYANESATAVVQRRGVSIV